MSKRLILAAVVASLFVAACDNPVSSIPKPQPAHASHDGTTAPGGNLMGGGS